MRTTRELLGAGEEVMSSALGTEHLLNALIVQ
jgi:hypothetical protein